jgi:hypothetical protein
MGRKTIALLFIRKNEHNDQPGALICDDTSGEFYPWTFYDWREAVHYIVWANKNINQDTYTIWCEQYGYYDEECFVGNLNEFKGTDEWYVFINDDIVQTVDNNTDMNNISVWSNTINISTQIKFNENYT